MEFRLKLVRMALTPVTFPVLALDCETNHRFTYDYSNLSVKMDSLDDLQFEFASGLCSRW